MFLEPGNGQLSFGYWGKLLTAAKKNYPDLQEETEFKTSIVESRRQPPGTFRHSSLLR